MTRDQIILDLQQQYALRRETNRLIFVKNEQEACNSCPGLRALLDARHEALINGIRTGITSYDQSKPMPESPPNVFTELNAKIVDALQQNNLPQNVLQPVYTCQSCKDEGYVYAPSRRMCKCFEGELNRRIMQELGLNKTNPQTFETFNEALFLEDVLPPYGASQRQVALHNRNICMEYADSFPNTATRDLLFVGQSGLGKTFLLQAIANRVAMRGTLPLYISAYRWFEMVRKAYFENDPELITSIMTSPLLLLDDLGTEPLMTNITITQLFNLLNERQIAGRHTVISTNLDTPELRERYTERITSRLLDSTGCRKLTFIGGDVRERLKKSGGVI